MGRRRGDRGSRGRHSRTQSSTDESTRTSPESTKSSKSGGKSPSRQKNNSGGRRGDKISRIVRPEFSMADEDFPALPGAKRGASRQEEVDRAGSAGSGSTVDSGSLSSADSGVVGALSSPTTTPPRTSTAQLVEPVPVKETSSSEASPPSFIKLTKVRIGSIAPELRGANGRRNRRNDKKTLSPQKNGKDNKDVKIGSESSSPVKAKKVEKTASVEKGNVQTHVREVHNTAEKYIQIDKATGIVSNLPASMIDDQFGMAAMVVRLREHPPVQSQDPVDLAVATGESISDDIALHLLTYGTTLAKLDVPVSDVNGKEDVWSTFAGPFGKTSLGVKDITEPILPVEYFTHSIIEKKMVDNMFGKIKSGELFFLFYHFANEVWQEHAARELYVRNWRYNKKERFWLRRVQCEFGFGKLIHSNKIGDKDAIGSTSQVTDTFEIGIYDVFDPIKWKSMTHELKVVYDDIEVIPEKMLPRTIPTTTNSVPGADWFSLPPKDPSLAPTTLAPPTRPNFGDRFSSVPPPPLPMPPHLPPMLPHLYGAPPPPTSNRRFF